MAWPPHMCQLLHLHPHGIHSNATQGCGGLKCKVVRPWRGLHTCAMPSPAAVLQPAYLLQHGVFHAAAPAFVTRPPPWHCTVAAAVAALVVVMQNASTPFGAFLDPVADKLMVAAVLILLSTQPLAAGPLAGNAWLMPVATLGEIYHWLVSYFFRRQTLLTFILYP